MPTYGSEKQRDMARSVLPSTRRKGARLDKRHQHHMVRSRVRNLIAKGDWDNEADLVLDPQRHKPYQGIKVVVQERREADNIGPIMRWAEANADKMGDTPQERYAKMRSMLPPNIIGWHAMTHIDNIDAYDVNPHRWWRYGYRRDFKAEREQKLRELVNILDYNVDRMGAINRDLKKRGWRHESIGGKIIGVPPRLWHGVHDSEEFANWILSQPLDWRRRGVKGGENGAGWMHLNIGARAVIAEWLGYDETW